MLAATTRLVRAVPAARSSSTVVTQAAVAATVATTTTATRRAAPANKATAASTTFVRHITYDNTLPPKPKPQPGRRLTSEEDMFWFQKGRVTLTQLNNMTIDEQEKLIEPHLDEMKHGEDTEDWMDDVWDRRYQEYPAMYDLYNAPPKQQDEIMLPKIQRVKAGTATQRDIDYLARADYERTRPEVEEYIKTLTDEDLSSYDLELWSRRLAIGAIHPLPFDTIAQAELMQVVRHIKEVMDLTWMDLGEINHRRRRGRWSVRDKLMLKAWGRYKNRAKLGLTLQHIVLEAWKGWVAKPGTPWWLLLSKKDPEELTLHAYEAKQATVNAAAASQLITGKEAAGAEVKKKDGDSDEDIQAEKDYYYTGSGPDEVDDEEKEDVDPMEEADPTKAPEVGEEGDKGEVKDNYGLLKTATKQLKKDLQKARQKKEQLRELTDSSDDNDVADGERSSGQSSLDDADISSTDLDETDSDISAAMLKQQRLDDGWLYNKDGVLVPPPATVGAAELKPVPPKEARRALLYRRYKEQLEPREITPAIAAKLTEADIQVIESVRCSVEPQRRRLRAYIEEQKQKFFEPQRKQQLAKSQEIWNRRAKELETRYGKQAHLSPPVFRIPTNDDMLNDIHVTRVEKLHDWLVTDGARAKRAELAKWRDLRKTCAPITAEEVVKAGKTHLGTNHAPVSWMNDKMRQHLQVVAFNEHWSYHDREAYLKYLRQVLTSSFKDLDRFRAIRELKI